MSNRITLILALLLLSATFLFAFSSMTQDALTFDEKAHIAAGYSYLTQQDYRINPEHPPLAKDLAALPLLFMDLNFPSQSQTWKQDSGAPPWWVQFDLGNELLYQSGNNPRQIILWSRIPMILLLLALGAFLFKWARELGGNIMGLLVLALFAFSPTFLAHGRLVTTDVAAAFGVVLGMYYWLKFLRAPSWGNIVKAGMALGIALLLKFTTVLLIPFFGILTVLYPLLFGGSLTSSLKSLANYTGKAVLAGLIAFIFVVWPVYQFHILNYPKERQLRDTAADLQADGLKSYEKLFAVNLIELPGMRPFAQYFRGVLMATQRGQFGNTTYFMGEVSAQAKTEYFPILFLAKTPIAFPILLLVGFAGIALSVKKRLYQGPLKGIKGWIQDNFTLFAVGLFTAGYWGTAVFGNLNIGIRHVLITFPFLYILALWGAKKIIEYMTNPRTKKYAIGVFGLLVFAFAASSLLAYPHYLSYYNEIAGGKDNGYKIAVDSNYDWGQDFYKLLDKVKEHNIDQINLHYFGGEDPAYWLGDKYIPYNPKIMAPPTGWLAVSVNELMGGNAKRAPGHDQPTNYYEWLLNYQPVDRAGTSIFLYFIPR